MPRSLPRRTEDALLLSSLALAVIVGKMLSASAQSPRARSEIDFTESAMAVSTPLNEANDSKATRGEAVGHSLQSPACLPRDATHPEAHPPLQ